MRKKYNISLKSKKNFKSTEDFNDEVSSKMTEEDKKILDIFNFFDFQTNTDTFVIYQAHRNHEEADCPLKRKKKVFLIEKDKNRNFLERGIIYANYELTKMVESNKSLIDYLTGNNEKYFENCDQNIYKFTLFYNNFVEDLLLGSDLLVNQGSGL